MQKPIANTKEVISYIKKNLKKENYESMFVAGSLPEKLISQSDLDIFIVLKKEKKNAGLDNLKNIMDTFIKSHKNLKYSFMRGPIKYKNHGLIHFLIYTNNRDRKDNGSFYKENIYLLKDLLKNYSLIKGMSLKSMIMPSDIASTNILKDDIQRFRRRYNKLKRQKSVRYRRWTKTRNGWQLIKHSISLSEFYKDYLFHYFNKHI